MLPALADRPVGRSLRVCPASTAAASVGRASPPRAGSEPSARRPWSPERKCGLLRSWLKSQLAVTHLFAANTASNGLERAAEPPWGGCVRRRHRHRYGGLAVGRLGRRVAHTVAVDAAAWSSEDSVEVAHDQH